MFSLTDLENIIHERGAVSDGSSYTASLLDKGTHLCGRKLGEEALELVIAAISGDDEEVVAESADLFYHLLVVLRSRNIALDDVMAELEKRTSRSGLEEKASRNSNG